MVTARFYPEYGGGAMQTLNLCRKLPKDEISSFVVTRDYSSPPSLFKTKEESVFDIKVHRLSTAFKRQSLSKLYFILRLLVFLLFHRRSCHIVHIHGIRHYAFPVIIACKILGKKTLAKMTAFGVDDFQKLKQKRFGRQRLRILSLIERVIATSGELSNSFRVSAMPSHKLVEIPNGVDTDTFKPLELAEKSKLRDKLGIARESIVVTFVGGVIKRKGVDLLINAWKKVVQAVPNAVLLIIGPKSKDESKGIHGYVTDNIIESIKKQKLDETVEFTGYVPNVSEYLQVSDIFVLPSSREGLPNALIEAMACGVAPVATRLDCISDLIEHGKNGFLFELGDRLQLSQRLISLAKNPDLRDVFGKESRRIILQKFSFDRIAVSYVSLYRELLTGNGIR